MSKESEEKERELRKQRKAKAIAANRPEIIKEEADSRVQQAVWDLDPPKQYVRREGWEKVLAAYIEKIKACGVTRPWKYFTFPGENALDIGHLYKKGLLDTNSEKKLSVAICDSKYGDTVALKLQKVGGVLASSNKKLDEVLGDDKDMLVRQFPFDVINLDLTNALVEGNLRNMYILDRLFDLQKGQGFLLLLTSRPSINLRDEQLNILVENFQTVPEFRDAYEAKYATLDVAASLADYTTFTQIVFSKIIAKYSRDNHYQVYEHFSAKYKRSNKYETYDMVVHSFELDPLVGKQPDSAKYEPRWDVPHKKRINQVLSGETIRHQAEEGYKSYICELPDRDILNVDSQLTDQPDLYNDLIKEAESLGTWLN